MFHPEGTNSMAEQKKPNFPSKLCPKCGKYIHAKAKSHPECGWTMTSSPATTPQPKHSPTATNGEKLSKMEAVRRVLKEHGKDTMPVAIQDHLKKQYSIKMEASVISNYKSTILNQKKKVGRPKTSKSAPIAVAAVVSTAEISLEDIRAVKHLADRIGVEKVKELAAVLAR
jgi:ribosomal protein L11